MEYRRWAPCYERIRADLGFPWPQEEAARDLLRSLLPAEARRAPRERLRGRFEDRDAIVVGLAPRAGAPPLWKLPRAGRRPTLVAADGAAERCLEASLVPDVVVTDLDGPVPSEVSANASGALVLVHAHGDNRDALARWVPAFDGELAGSWAGAPDEELVNPGGFTDGDRAAYLAADAGAKRVLLWGFDFGELPPDEPRPAAKRAKLRWARVALDLLAGEIGDRLLLWERDGRLRPYVSGAPSTQ